MTKKHFIQLADTIKNHNALCEDSHSNKVFNEVQIGQLANFCASQNPNFDRNRWFDYIAGKCGPSGGKI